MKIFRNHKSDRPAKIGKEAYGERILSRFILTSGNRYFELCKELNIQESFFAYSSFLLFLLYIARKILEQKYSSSDVDVIANSSIDGIVDLLDYIKFESKADAKNILKCQYEEYLTENINIFDKNGMHKFVKLYETHILGIEYDFICYNSIYIEFSLFIKYHLEDILNSKIELI